MIITTTILNNIESSITNPQSQGIFYITKSNNILSASYNNIITQIEAGNLPIIKNIDTNYIDYELITAYGFQSPNYYILTTDITGANQAYINETSTDLLRPENIIEEI